MDGAGQEFIAQTSTTGIQQKPDNDYGDGGSDDSGLLPVTRLRRQYLDYLGAKVLEIEEQKQARHYYHGAQWTAEEVRALRARRQPVVTYNRINRKINSIVGLTERLRQDPKAFPRKPRNEDGAEVATATIRYVCDTNDWKTKSAEVARIASIEGIGGIELKLREGDKGDPDVEMELVFVDDFFYDPRSYRYDFSDARYMGIAKWLDVEAAVELFPDKEEEIRAYIENGYDLTTYADREYKWIYVNEKRVRLVEHWYRNRNEWHWAFYISFHLLDQGTSPFLNERGKTMARFMMFSAAVDHDGDRYGFFRNMKGPQDEINQRRSKALHISNSRRLIIDKGAVDDVEIARREWARPDGVVEKNPGAGEVKPDDTRPDLEAQMTFLQEAKAEIDQFADVRPATQGEMPKNISGRAINLLQQGGVAELGAFIIAYRGWKIRVYRAIWNIVQRYWTSERWIRVTDDQEMAQFIQLNGLELDASGRPQLVNFVGALDVDMALDEGPDVINMMADTYDTLSALAASGAQIPNIGQILLELAPIQGSIKKRMLDMMKQPPDPVDQAGKQLAIQRMLAEIEEKQANVLLRTGTAAMNAAKAGLNAQEIEQRGFAFLNQPSPGFQPPPGTPNGPQGPVAPVPGPSPLGGVPNALGKFLGSPPPAAGATSPPGAAGPPGGPGGPPPGAGASPPQLPGALAPYARQAPDGFHYVPDPTRPGKWLKVAA